MTRVARVVVSWEEGGHTTSQYATAFYQVGLGRTWLTYDRMVAGEADPERRQAKHR